MNTFFKLFYIIYSLFSFNLAQASPRPQFIKHSNLLEWKQATQKKEKQIFLKTLCQKQIEFKKIPSACFLMIERKREAEAICLKLTFKNFSEADLVKALKSKGLTKICRDHLANGLQLIHYRKRDLNLFIKN